MAASIIFWLKHLQVSRTVGKFSSLKQIAIVMTRAFSQRRGEGGV